MSEWKNLIENIYRLASTEAEAEHKGRMESGILAKLNRKEFKENVISDASKFAHSIQMDLNRQFPAKRHGDELLSLFTQSLEHFREGTDTDLEKIFQDSYDRL